MLCKKYTDFLDLVLYQVYPRSFMDSNADGIGDLNGVISKLDYLKDLGVNAIWFSPCFKSPNDDNGYDISDYRDIMDEFGTLEDAKRLIAEMHKREMKVIFDLVANHTSTAHKWFQESRKSKDNPYSDYYYWYDSPPNEWRSAFGGSAWGYDEARGQYYLHSFAPTQADLNWENPKVVREMQDVVDYWVDLGVDGFRCDVIDMISKDIPNNKTAFGPRIHEFVNALFGREKTRHLFTVGESWTGDIDRVYRFCASEREEMSTLFQFEHINHGRTGRFAPEKPSLKEISKILSKWVRACEEKDLLYMLFTDNHDQPWFVPRMTESAPERYEAATLMAGMFYTLRGVPLIYQGQEFGTAAPYYEEIEFFDDIETRNGYKNLIREHSKPEAMRLINFGSRDNTRHPVCWDGSEFGGFSTVKPWLAVHSECKCVNLKSDLASEKSVFRFYKELFALRKKCKALIYGSFEEISQETDNFFAFERVFEDERITVVCNFEDENTVEIKGQLLLSNYSNADVAGNHYRKYEVRIYK